MFETTNQTIIFIHSNYPRVFYMPLDNYHGPMAPMAPMASADPAVAPLDPMRPPTADLPKRTPGISVGISLGIS